MLMVQGPYLENHGLSGLRAQRGGCQSQLHSSFELGQVALLLESPIFSSEKWRQSLLRLLGGFTDEAGDRTRMGPETY